MPKPRRPKPDVLIHLWGTSAYDREVIRGVVEYNRVHREWRIHGHPLHVSPSVPSLATWRGAGVIGRLTAEDRIPRGCRAVNVSGVAPPPGVPFVGADDEAIGRLAAQHLLERELRRLVFVGLGHLDFSERRRKGFLDRVAMEGPPVPVESFTLPARRSFDHQGKLLQRWAARLPTPVGVTATMDVLAWRVAEAARAVGLDVPGQVAVLGVDDDALLCEVADPPLSSVRVPARAIGYRAAEVLDRMLRGEPPPDAPIRFPPIGVTVRMSTDMTAVEDDLVARTLSVIRSTPLAEVRFAALFDRLPASRRVIERRFQAVLGRTVWQEFQSHRLRHAQDLLARTDLSLEHVAAASGFSDAKQLGAAFRKELRSTPTAHRQSFRATARDRF